MTNTVLLALVPIEYLTWTVKLVAAIIALVVAVLKLRNVRRR